MKFPVAIQLYTVRDAAKEDFYGTLKQIKEMGYDGVEFAGLHGHTPEEVRDMVNELGLIPISAHVAYVDMIADPDGVFEAYKTIGCKYITIPYLNEEHRPGSDKFEEVMASIEKLGMLAKKHGLTLLYHNHDFEFIMINGEYGLDILYKVVPAEALQTEIDTCWVNVGGENPAEYLLKYTGRAPVLHLKDFEGEKSEDMYELIGINRKAPARPANFGFRPVGYGKQNFPQILEAAEKAGVQWVVVEMDRAPEGQTPLECAKLSRDYLKSIGC